MECDPEEGEEITLDQYLLQLARAGDHSQLSLLLPDADPFYHSLSKNNCLHYAAANSHLQTLRLVAECWAAKTGQRFREVLNFRNADGNTPLHYSLFSKSKEVVAYLMSLEPDTTLRNLAGRTALEEAEQLEEWELGEIIATQRKATKEQIEALSKEIGSMAPCQSVAEEAEQEESKE